MWGHSEAVLQSDLDANYKASYRCAIEHFLDCLASEAPFETSPVNNLETLKWVEDAYARTISAPLRTATKMGLEQETTTHAQQS